MIHTFCPCCRCQNLDVFFTVPNAPTQSLVTIRDREEALAIPRKDIKLTFCNGCGFIFNSAFDTSIDYFTQGYEDQQGFSPTFVKFLTDVSERFIDKYGMRGKMVVEVGCGKGDYLRLFCRIGDNTGVGVDPAWVPGRGEDVEGVDFIQALYDESHGALNPDCITCRHTLEHIHDTAGFMETIRTSAAKSDPLLFFEVPSIVRILEVQAFWDIFYEHCSYFSPGSLARLFRRNGFDVLDLFLEYDKQYLFIEAKPAENPQDRIHSLEESIARLKAMTERFGETVDVQLSEWRARLEQFKKEGKKVVIWGGGSKSVGFLTQFDDIGLFDHVVDINPYMTGNFIPGIGKQYVAPEYLKTYKPDAVVVMNSVYMDEIKESLGKLGVYPEMLAL